MSRRGSWGPMSERVGPAAPASSPAPASTPSPAGQADRTPSPGSGLPALPDRLKHCWVVDEHGRLPALLLGWRRLESGYQGRVVRPVWDADLGWVVVEEWLPAHLLEPA